MSTEWVGEHYDGPAGLRQALRVAKLAAGLEAVEGPGNQPHARTAGEPSGDGRWRAAGRADAIDRWPA